MKKRVVEVVSTFVLRKLARRGSSHYDQIARIPAVAGSVAGKPVRSWTIHRWQTPGTSGLRARRNRGKCERACTTKVQ